MNDSINAPDSNDLQAISGKLTSAQGIDLGQIPPLTTQVQAWQTEQGTQVRFVESHQLPMVDLLLRFNAGSAMDLERSGLAALTLYMLDKGSEQLDAGQRAEQTEQLGAIVSAQLQLEHVTLRLRSLSDAALLGQAIGLFTEMVARPAFAEPQLAKVKQQVLAHQAGKSPAQRAHAEAFSRLYQGHPYGNPSAGTAADLEALTGDDLRAFHQRAYSANNLQLSIVGDLSRADAEALASQLAESLPQGWAAAELPPAPANEAATVHIDSSGASQAVLFAVPMSGHPTQADFPALALAIDVLGTGLDSRLMREMRQRRGLTYGVGCLATPHKAGGELVIDWDCAAHYGEASQALVSDILAALVEQGPSEAELALARRLRSGRLVRTVATNEGLLDLLSITCAQGLPADHINTYLQQLQAVTVQSARQALQHQLDPSRRVVVSIGPTVAQQPLPEVAAVEQ
nr:pitrilysin family protein [uncultured Pseudomonas sp.]